MDERKVGVRKMGAEGMEREGRVLWVPGDSKSPEFLITHDHEAGKIFVTGWKERNLRRVWSHS